MNLSALEEKIFLKKNSYRLIFYHWFTELISSETQTSNIYKPPT